MIANVALSNTFNEFRTTTNEVIGEVNKLTDGTAVLSIDSITANTFVGVVTDLDVAGDSGNTIITLGAEVLTIAGGTGLSSSVSGNTVTINLDNTAVVANTYGSASQVPVITVDAQGRITSANTVSVAGVSDFDYYSANATYVIMTADGGSYSATADLNAFSTNNLSEGLSNLYFTTQRARDSFSNGTGVTITNGSVAIGQSVATTANVTFNKVTVNDAPSASTDLANKQYVDEVAQGILAKPSVRAATTTNLSANYNNGTLGVGATLTADTNRAFTTLDGVTNWAVTSPPMGILVKNQTNPAHNGRYNLTTLGSGSEPWVLTKCALCDESDEIPGAYVFVSEGTLYAGTGWVQTVVDPETFVVGTDAVIVTQFSGAGTYTAGTGLTLNGTQFNIANTAVTAGSYSLGSSVQSGTIPPGSVTVDAQGRVTAISVNNITATSANGLSTLVERDGSGSFSAGTITATFSGNGSALTTLNATNISSGTLSGDRGVTAGSTSSSFVEYNGTTATAGQFDGGTTTPSGTTRLNYGGNFYATNFNAIGVADTATAASHYYVETGSDGFIRPKTLANAQAELVTAATVYSVGVTSGTATQSFVRYNSTTATTGAFDGGTTTPTGTTRLNYGGNFYATGVNLIGTADTATAASHYMVETGSDGFVRPKTLANVQTEVVTAAATYAVGVTAGAATQSFVRYNGTTATAGQFDGGFVAPTGTTRLNYSGNFCAALFTGSGANLNELSANNISTGTLAVARGGTGANTLTANAVVLGNGTSAVQTVAPGASGNLLVSDGTTWTSSAFDASDQFARTIAVIAL
jgi:hypothetical protein